MIIVATCWMPCLFQLHAIQHTQHFNMIIKRMMDHSGIQSTKNVCGVLSKLE
jgi:hypothetical protein